MQRTHSRLISYGKPICILALLLLTLAATVIAGYGLSGARASNTPALPIGRPIINHSPTFPVNINRPVLAFYYPWYNSKTWCLCTMSDLPTIKYNSADEATIERQVNMAASAGITGFISSWWGQGDQTDSNLAKVLAYSATLERTMHLLFASTIYFESDAPALQGEANIVRQLRYLTSNYANSRYFFHWQGKPVIFFWDEFGHGRTLAMWASVRSQVDPHHTMLWSAEGTDLNALSVFDGIHLFSAAYWGIQHNNITAVDQGFRNEIDAYNKAHHTQKIWVAGVLPGYNDTRVPGRQGTYIVPRDNGATYRASWNGAVASNPDWITITSFNEWFEGSMLEPSVTYGNLYMNLTNQLAWKWRA
jgi:hypothetical protein